MFAIFTFRFYIMFIGSTLLISCSAGIVSNKSFQKVDWQLAKKCAPANIESTTIQKMTDPKFVFGLTAIRKLGGGLIYELGEGASLLYNGIEYQVSTLRVVAPSNHQLVGLPFLLELQFFAVSKANQPLAISILVRKGEDHQILRQLIEANVSEINLADLLPKYSGHYSYVGALPIEPCYQVTWVIMKSAISASANDLDAYLKKWPSSSVQTSTIEPIFETE